MAQIGRAVKRALLSSLPNSAQTSLLDTFPNLRKVAPEISTFVFPAYDGDIKVNINTRFSCDRLMWSGEFEMPLLNFIRQEARIGWKCIDVGANVGAVSLVLAKYIGEDGVVLAFEPGEITTSRLYDNLALNPAICDRINVHSIGIGREHGELFWSEDPEDPGNGLIATSGSQMVKILSLDEFAQLKGISRVDFIKIDAEGSEFDVLCGAQEMIQKHHPIIYLETLSRFSSMHGGKNFQLIRDFLEKKCGYKLSFLDDNGRRHPVQDKLKSYTVASIY